VFNTVQMQSGRLLDHSVRFHC